MELAKVDAIVDRNGVDPATLIAVLQDVQEEYSYLPKDALTRVAHKLKVPLSRVYSVANFYKAFSLKPRGRHLIQVCLGTACHVRGGDKILEKLARDLDVEAGDTTADGRFTLEAVHCLGCCSLAPAMVVDEVAYGRLKQDKLARVLKKYE